MRKTFIKSLVELAEQDGSIWLLTADMGWGLIEPFSERFPERFINVGVAEQNMIGVAAGLAMSGKRVYCYSIANFPTMRCLEQIRNDVCYHNLSVTIVAGGGGLAYGALGMTHHTTEDIAIMRALPGMTVIAPGDVIEVGLAARETSKRDGACYLRLGKMGNTYPVNPTDDIYNAILTTRRDFVIGKASLIREGKDATIISTGEITYNVMLAAETLSHQDCNVRVLSMHTVKPLDKMAVIKAAQEIGTIITVEEHNIIGGLGSAVAEVLAGREGVTFKRLGIPDVYCHQVGTQEELQKEFHLDVDGIVEEVLSAVR